MAFILLIIFLGYGHHELQRHAVTVPWPSRFFTLETTRIKAGTECAKRAPSGDCLQLFVMHK
jgi:hypothetical protein